MRRLEIGPGIHPLEGNWERLDIKEGHDHVAAWGEEPLPFDDNTFNEVYASHVLEHIPWYHTKYAVREVHRILVPGGTFEVWVPNIEYIIKCYMRGVCGDNWRRENVESDPMLWFNGRVYAYGAEENWHKAAFNDHSLFNLMRGFFSNVRLLGSRERGISHGPIDLGAIGEKW